MADSDDLEGFILTASTILSAICLSLVGVLVGFYAFFEDQMMRRYKREGVKVQSKVMSTRAVRGKSAPSDCTPQIEAELEYIAEVEYKLIHETGFYKTVVRKQVRAVGSAFEIVKPPSEPKVVIDLEDVKLLSDFKAEAEPPKEMELLMLPEFPKSGLSLVFVEKSCEISYRLPTYAFTLLVIALACFFVFLGFNSLPSVDTSHHVKLGYSVASVGGFILIEALISYVFLRSWIDQMIREEYLEAGVVDLKSDGTLSTFSSYDTVSTTV